MRNYSNNQRKKLLGPIILIGIIPIVVLLFANNSIIAQTVSLSPEQCGHAIAYGNPIFCTSNDNAEEYEFKFFASNDSTVITSQRNFIPEETYRGVLQTDLVYRTIVRCRLGENWSVYGDTCIIKIKIDWFTEMQALYGSPAFSNRTEFNCSADLNTEYKIPVVFHVIVPDSYNGEDIVEYLPPDKINQQLEIINNFFAGRMAEVGDSVIDAKMYFCFAKKDNNDSIIKVEYNGATYYGITYRSRNEGRNVSVEEIGYPSSLYENESAACSYYNIFPRDKYLNIFVLDSMSSIYYYGEGGSIAALGDQVQFSHIRIRRDVVGGNYELQDEGKDMGYTAVHELGHFFGLKHTFPDDDGIHDLDQQTDPPHNCIETEPNVHNVMNYINDECKRYFTRGQVCRMREIIRMDNELYSLVNSPVSTECDSTLTNLYSANIISPIENIVCLNRTDIIAIRVDDVRIVKQISINDSPIYLEDSDVEIDTIAGTIEFQYAFDAIGYYDIKVSCGFDNISSNWRTIHKVVEAVECETPTENREKAQWYYDSYASLDFRDGLARFKTDSNMDANESESSICDSLGNLLFYTDGRQVWNSQHIPLVNPLPESQIKERSTIILKFSRYKYAIISIQENDGRLYGCIVDVSNGLNANTTLSWDSLPMGNGWTDLYALSAAPTVESNKYWLLTTKKIGETYYTCSAKLAYDSINNAIVVSDKNIDLSNEICSSKLLSIKISPNAEYVLYSTEFNGIKFYRFYARSGVIEKLQNCNPSVGEKGSSIEFSSDSRFLYIANMSAENELVINQYFLKQLTRCECFMQQTEIFRWKAPYNRNFQSEVNLQRAPDGRIYIGRYSQIYSNSRMIGVILNPNVRDSLGGRENICGVRMHVIDYNDTRFINHINFPNFVDVEKVDSCKVDFQVCGDWCPNGPHQINIDNLSNTGQNTWRFFDENDSEIARCSSNYQTNNGRPDTINFTSIYSHQYVTIELSSAYCPEVRTISIGRRSDIQPQISGPGYICKDGQPHSYHIIDIPQLDPQIQVQWTSPYHHHNSDIHLTYNPESVVNNPICLVAQISDNTTGSCPYTASRFVYTTEINYIPTPFPYCNENQPGSVLFNINNYQGTNTLPPFNFSDNSGNEYSNESPFTIANLPIGQYSFNITNEYCNYVDSVEIESALSDININVIPDCIVDTIKIWNENNTSLSGYVFTLRVSNNSYEKTTDESVLTFVVSHYSDYAPIVVGSSCSIDILGPDQEYCSLTRDIYIPPHPQLKLISHCNNDNTAYVEIILRNVADRNLLSFRGQFNVEYGYTDVYGVLHYYISNISCSYMYNINNILYVEYDGCVLYKGPIDRCALKIASEYKAICESGGLTDIALRLYYAVGGAATASVIWYKNDTLYQTTHVIQISDSSSISYLNNVTAGTYHYVVHFGDCIREGTVEVVETEDPEYTIVIDNDTVCLNITSLPSGTNRLVVRNADGSIIVNREISEGQRYCFHSDGRYYADIITICDTFPVYFNVSNINVNLESEACYKSTVAISFEISGGTAPYTATFTSGSLTTTQTFSSSGQNVMYAEIIQGAANSLVVESADGHSYSIDLTTINYISGFATLPNNQFGEFYNSYSNQTLIVPNQPLSFSRDVTFTNCTIYCAYNDYNNIDQTQWTVPLGKTVVFDNCTIKSGCPDKMWKGVKIAGTDLSAQSNAMGTVVFVNNSSIEDADTAFHSIHGGIIYAYQSAFKNNKCDIAFGKYTRYFHTLTTIRECSFKTTRLLNNPSVFPEAHISMTGVNGIKIDSCLFANEMAFSTANIPEIGTPYYTDNRGIGISSTGSYFYTDKTNTFNGLYYAVHASGLNRYPVSITKSVMNNVFRGIYVNDNNGCIVQGNDITCQNSNLAFTPTNNPPSVLPAFALKYNTPYGAYLNSCTGFTFEHNTIKKAGTGLYVNNSGGDDNRVENNIFGTALQGNTNGMVAIGTNSNFVYNGGTTQSGNVGLQALCNVFTGNSYDFGVYSGNMRKEQGTNTDPAGNQFYKLSVNSNLSHKQFTTQGFILTFTYGNNAYTYYQHDDAATGNINNYYRELQANHYDHVEPAPTNEYFTLSYCDCETPPELPIIPWPPIFGRTNIGELQQLDDTVAAKTEALTKKIDGGNTETTLSKVAAITQLSASSVDEYDYDGYLSDTVYSALICKIEENPILVTSALIENSPLPAETYEDAMAADISSVLKYVLSYYQNGESNFEKDKKEISRLGQDIACKERILYLSAVYDTSETVQNEIVEFFANKNSIDGKSKALDMLLFKNDFAEASELVADIRSLGTDAANKYADAAEFVIERNANPDMAKIRLQDKREYLEELIADSSYLYSGKAMSLYKYAFDTILPDYTPMFDEVLAPKSKTTNTLQLPNVFTVYPNPTNDFVAITINKEEINDETIKFLEHYGMQSIEDCENVVVNILDANGRMLSTQCFNYYDDIILNIKNYTSGTYIVEIISCFSDVYSTKIIKI